MTQPILLLYKLFITPMRCETDFAYFALAYSQVLNREAAQVNLEAGVSRIEIVDQASADELKSTTEL